MKVVVVAKSAEQCSERLLRAVSIIGSCGAEVVNSPDWGTEILSSPSVSGADFCLVLGGDGTILSVCRKVLGKIPVLGINFGHLGYLAAGEPDETEEILKRALKNQVVIEERLTLKAVSDGKVFYGVNEAVLQRAAPHMIDVKVNIDGVLADVVHADGVMAATPTGSTAYNLSAGGPIILPTAESLVITPICAHSLGARPIVVGKEDVITFIPSRDAELTLDGISAGVISAGKEVTISSGEKIKLMKTRSDGFFRTLRRKLSGNSYQE